MKGGLGIFKRLTIWVSLCEFFGAKVFALFGALWFDLLAFGAAVDRPAQWRR